MTRRVGDSRYASVGGHADRATPAEDAEQAELAERLIKLLACLGVQSVDSLADALPVALPRCSGR